MMIIAIAVSTMVTVAIVVFVMQYLVYRKNHVKRDKACISKERVGAAHEAPIAS
jgi:hypothetical protein